jgi:ADP-heptose:LPS heptosyltransferase
VTLGADVAVTSVLMDSVRRRFPEASIRFVGPRKNYELFAGDSRVLHVPFEYPRSGSLVDRLKQWGEFFAADSIVVDPDSRLTQLGILPVCDEKDYFFFESRAYYPNSTDALPRLASRWSSEVFGEPGRAWIAPADQPLVRADVAVSLGVGGNEAKRLPDPFEEKLLRFLVERGFTVIVDEGGGGDETERVRALAERIPELRTWSGSFSGFAKVIASSDLYVGYDSAGQHVAAAAGVPLVSVFGGYASERTFERWKAWGPGPREIVKVTQRDIDVVLQETMQSVNALTGRQDG